MDREEVLISIEKSLSSLDTKYDTLYRELLGNGQPGRIQRLEADNADLHIQFVKFEKKRSFQAGWVAGISAVIGGVAGLAVNILHFITPR